MPESYFYFIFRIKHHLRQQTSPPKKLNRSIATQKPKIAKRESKKIKKNKTLGIERKSQLKLLGGFKKTTDG